MGGPARRADGLLVRQLKGGAAMHVILMSDEDERIARFDIRREGSLRKFLYRLSSRIEDERWRIQMEKLAEKEGTER